MPLDMRKHFTQVTEGDLPHRHIVVVTAHEKRGKTHWGLTAPPPIAYLNLDAGIHRVNLRKWFPHLLKKGQLEQIELTRKKFPDWKERRAAYEAALVYASRNYRSVVVDTEVEAYRVIRMAEWGKLSQVPMHLYPKVTQVYKDILDQVKGSDANIILLTRPKKKYVSAVMNTPQGKKEVSSWDGESYIRDGFGELAYFADTFIECVRNPVNEDNEESLGFGIEVQLCGPNPEIDGDLLEGGVFPPTFQGLALAAFPESEPEDWE